MEKINTSQEEISKQRHKPRTNRDWGQKVGDAKPVKLKLHDKKKATAKPLMLKEEEKEASAKPLKLKDDDEKAITKPVMKLKHDKKKVVKGLTDTTEDINESAEAFIKKFRQQLLIQRLDSIEKNSDIEKISTCQEGISKQHDEKKEEISKQQDEKKVVKGLVDRTEDINENAEAFIKKFNSNVEKISISQEEISKQLDEKKVVKGLTDTTEDINERAEAFIKKFNFDMEKISTSQEEISKQQDEKMVVKGLADTTEDINESAEAFIKKFRQQLLIQRLNSIEKYKQMLARGL
ncbi:hypothetical protein Drorol1_Dr00013572 [Drosera rotundifolia]